MIKLIRRLVVFCVVLGAAAVGLALTLDGLVAKGIEKGGTYALGVPVSVGSAKIGVLSGDVAVSGLSIANPQGFAPEPFFSMKTLAARAPAKDLLANPIVLERVEITGVRVALEQNLTQSNWGVIVSNLKRFQGSEKTAEEAGARRVVIRELVLSDVEVAAALSAIPGQAARQALCLPPIRLQNVGGEGGRGALVGDVAAAVIDAVLAAAARGGGGVLSPATVAGLEGAVRGLATGGAAGIDDALRTIKDDPAKAIQQGIGTILGGKKK